MMLQEGNTPLFFVSGRLITLMMIKYGADVNAVNVVRIYSRENDSIALSLSLSLSILCRDEGCNSCPVERLYPPA